MRILFINTVDYGSTGKIVTSIFNYCESRGDKCLFFYGRQRNKQINRQKNKIKICNYFSILIDALFSRIFDNAGFNSVLTTRRLIKKIKKFQPDIVNIHNIHGYYLNFKILLKYLAKTKVKVVFTLHDCWNFTGHCTHFESINCLKWQQKCEKCPLKKRYPSSWIADNSKKNFVVKKEIFTLFDKNNVVFICPSKWIETTLKCSFLKKFNAICVRNSFDFANIKKPNAYDPNTMNRYILGVAAPFTSQKGFNDFLELSKLLNDGIRIKMVGLNKKQIKIVKKYKNIDGYNRIDSRSQLMKLYSEALLFVNLTYEDTFPTVNIEAIANGTPVLTYDVGGSVESANFTSLYTEKGNIAKVAQIINAFSVKKRNTYVNNFDDNELKAETMCENYRNIFLTLAEGNK